MGATTSRAITRPLAAWRGTVSISATGVTRSRMMRSTSSTGSSGPEKAKQSSVSCAITRAPHAPARLGSARRAGSEGRRCARCHRDRPPEPAQLVDELPTVRRADQNFARPGHAMGVGILAWLVDVEAMMGVLERRYLEPPRDDAGDDLSEERRLAGAAPAGEADDAHAAL